MVRGMRRLTCRGPAPNGMSGRPNLRAHTDIVFSAYHLPLLVYVLYVSAPRHTDTETEQATRCVVAWWRESVPQDCRLRPFNPC